MTDKETLFGYRLREAEETVADAEKMLTNNLSARSIVNRAYYAMFYSVLALFIRFDVEHKTSKHSGIISIFDKEIVRTGRLSKEYSKMLHRIFDARQECDYKELVELSVQDAANYVRMAKDFVAAVTSLIKSETS